jgi:hypothetical protein
LYWPEPALWSGSAVFRLISDDGSEKHDFKKGDGVASGKLVAFTFHDALPGLRYRGLLVDGDITLSLFASVDICALQHPADPCRYLPFPNPDDQHTGAQPSDPATRPAAAAPAGQPSSDDLTADDGSAVDYPVDLTAVRNAASSPPSPPTGTPFA